MTRPLIPPPGQPPQFRSQPSTGPVVNKALQQQFPGIYARTINATPLRDTVISTRSAFATLNQVRTHQTVRDHELANLDDTMKRGGSLLIATLATLGLRQRVFGVGEFLGFGSWFGAMALTPKIINALVLLKTGVNLNQKYESTYGQRQNIFKDPNYLPLQILSEADINRAANKLGIPAGPERRKQTETKMRQIAVQAHTWWMLVAGPATPVISGLICDQLQDPAIRLLNGTKLLAAEQAASSAASRGNAEQLAKKSEAYLNQLIGELPESSLSSWWKDFGRGMTKRAGLAKALSIPDVVDASREELTEKLVAHFSTLDAASPTLTSALKYVDEQKAKITELETNAGNFLKRYDGKMTEDAFKRQQKLVETRIANTMSTLVHYETLFNAVKNKANAKEIRNLLEKPVLAEVQRLIDTGYRTRAEKMVGIPSLFNKIREALGIRQFGRAFDLMGASPAAHLQSALKDTKLRAMWQRRIGWMLGGGLLVATILFNQFVIGRDFKRKGEET